MDINSLLKTEAKATGKMQGAFKSMVANAVKKHGIDKQAVLNEIRPQIKKLATDNVRLFMTMGVRWLK